MTECDHIIKIIMVGEAGVGKSSILSMYCEDSYCNQYAATIGVDFFSKNLIIDGKKIKLQIWDTAGQERFRSITSSYYRGASVVILVFDMSNVYSFSKLNYWLTQIKIFMPDNNYKIIIFGNKCDSEINVNENMISEFTKKNKVDFVKVSAKQNIGIDTVFNDVVSEVIKSFPLSTTNNIIIDNKKSRISNQCCYW